MKQSEKFPESTAIIRFPDCDGYNHLNNSRYLDYFMNAREDHLQHFYNLNIYRYMQEHGKGWVVSQHEIAYLRPAMLMESVVLRSVLIQLGENDLRVEMQMLDQSGTIVKALLWSRFVHIDTRTGKRIAHHQDLIDFFKPLEVPFEHRLTFEERALQIKLAQKG